MISDNEDHHIDSMHHEPFEALKDWHYESDGGAAISDETPDLQEGHFVQRHHVNMEPKPHDLCDEVPSKCMRVSENTDDMPGLTSTRHFTKEFEGIAAKILGLWKTLFESVEEVESKHSIGQTKTDEFLKLRMVHNSSISFNSTWSFLKKVDSLHMGPAWTCEMIDVMGNVVGEDGTLKHEQLELWRRDPVKCMEELIGNPVFWDMTAYVPEHAYADVKGDNCIYDEMWTGDWWWDVQMRLPKGAVVAPVILSSDKTTLSQFSGDKKAWPVYLTIGNISKDVRLLPEEDLFIGRILALPSCDVLGPPTSNRRGSSWQGNAYVTNFPEQCLVACNKESRCPRCLVETDKRGDLEEWAWQRMADMIKTLQHKQKNKQLRKFDTQGLCVVYKPFWKDLPFCDIFTCITLDIVHQLHKGIFHDHLLQWCTSLIGEKEIDACFQAVTRYPALHHFKKGISTISQWTGMEHKEMQQVFMGLLSGVVDDDVLLVARSLLDFIYYAQFQQHTDTSLRAMGDSLKMFHNHKHVLVELEVRQDFNLPKLHSLQHYVTSIRSLGSMDGYNTKYPE
ncbi:hypothetical protein EDC04DRAFT_2904169 [Pisolithus marmoratus]|nr:hypothetical protein EDC04DRAFT_2904169 [Pisolithus marmoratus]